MNAIIVAYISKLPLTLNNSHTHFHVVATLYRKQQQRFIYCNNMTLENIISFGFGIIAINIPTPNLDIQTPLQEMFSTADIHEIIISGIKVIVAGLVSVGINKIVKWLSKPSTEKQSA